MPIFSQKYSYYVQSNHLSSIFPVADENILTEKGKGRATLHLKKNRRILNKVEFTKLQWHYETCMEDIKTLEDFKHSVRNGVPYLRFGRLL